MEHRYDLEKLLLDGLDADERRHVIATMNQATADSLRRKRSEHVGDDLVSLDEPSGSDEELVL